MKKNNIKLIPTLREVEIALKKLDKQILIQKLIAGKNPSILLDTLIDQKKNLVELLAHRTNPKNAVRSSLPKKQQRKLGLLPQI